MPNLMRSMIDSLLPKGSAWVPKRGGNYDNLLNGIADCSESVRVELDKLSEIRNPKKTPVLSDLEREYGETPNILVSEDTRRMRLAARKNNRLRNGSIDQLQMALDNAGFNLFVHENSPSVDPSQFIDKSFSMYAGGPNSYAGNTLAFAKNIGGELLVNGDLISQTPAYLMQAGGTYTAGNTAAVAGQYNEFNQNAFQYTTPTDPNDWPLVFFVGGVATRDGTGSLTSIESGLVPLQRKSELKKTILKIKPLHSWAGLVISFT